MDQLTQFAWVGALLFTRIGAVLMLAPGWGEQLVPVTFRLAAALLATAALAPVLAANAPPPPANIYGAAPLIVSELATGLILGGAVRLLMSALQVAGAVTGMASGLGFAQQIDPSMGQQSAIFSAFFSLMGLLLVMAAGLHRLMLEAAAASYQTFPPGAPPPLLGASEQIVGAVADAFTLGVQISAPVLIFSFVANLALGLASRLVPQVQMYMVAQPATILGAVAILAFGLGGGLMVWLEAMEEQARLFLPG